MTMAMTILALRAPAQALSIAPRSSRLLLLNRGMALRGDRSSLRARASKYSNLELEEKGEKRRKPGNALYLLLLANLGVYALDHWLEVPGMKLLYLYHNSPRWYQFITATFCHGNWGHISSNLFFLYMFGKLVEEEEGGFGLWASYIVTGVGANLLSWLLLPGNVVSIGASGAVFGLFAISVLVKLSWDWRKLLEVLVLGQFVVNKVVEETQMLQAASSVNHVAHCAGAMVGVLLIWALSKIPAQKHDH
ncbi:hypothetical protein SELMODRAFT_146877 [Selaginella moellendorffii]|uniref:Peptidase S54 rhomboid domain-containing protein n=1 Tax=Selaginella moellendorffii TaxID=88036 RepID=D8RG62_SELML|nr:hypothetical protein SELMODRAFT_146877 [Selaginella moellendorffii]